MDPRPVQAEGALRSAASAQAHHAIDPPLREIFPDNAGHVLRSAVHHHAMRLVAAGAENRTADGENAGKGSAIQIDSPVLDQATRARFDVKPTTGIFFAGRTFICSSTMSRWISGISNSARVMSANCSIVRRRENDRDTRRVHLPRNVRPDGRSEETRIRGRTHSRARPTTRASPGCDHSLQQWRQRNPPKWSSNDSEKENATATVSPVIKPFETLAGYWSATFTL